MAVESKSTDCFFSLNEASITNSSNAVKSFSNNKTKEMSSKNRDQLNFYESMYHFKKMFPKLDCDVIETVLRANDGSVDKTIDQLLTMTADNELNEIASEATTPTNVYDTCFNLMEADLPPSYESLTSNQRNNVNTATDKLKVENRKSITKSHVIVDDSINSNINSIESQLIENGGDKTNIEIFDKSKNNDNNNSKLIEDKLEAMPTSNKLSTSSSFASRFSNIMIGELSKDFLRIKLTSDQVKKIKTSIKKAKRNELTAILNNKVPDKPDLSFEIKKKLNELKMDEKESNEINVQEYDDDEKWKIRYDEITKTCEKRRLQIIQDEYIAKLIQNEEFLNELRSDNDFIQTLNNESNSIRINNTKMNQHLDNINFNNNMSNAELKLKLGFMGKASRVKLSKLAAAFLIKAKNKYNKALDQTTITCTNLFTNFNTLKNIDYPSSTNNSYYMPNNSNKNEDDAQFINSLKNVNSINIRNDGSYKLDDKETYDIDRIKAEEFNLSRFDKYDNKYKKVYRSFKTAMKRNSSASSSSSSSLGSSISSNNNLNKNSANNFSEFEIFKNQLPKINWDSTNNTTQDLIAFKDDYSYDQYLNNFNSSIYSDSKK